MKQMVMIGIFVFTGISLGENEDWPQWMGARRDGTWRQSGTLTQFPSSGLELVWQKPIGAGFSGPAVSGGRVFVTDFVKSSGISTNNPSAKDRVTGEERLLVLDELTGRLLWTYRYPLTIDVSYASGPRTTPTVEENLVFILGTGGHLAAIQVASGEPLWSLELPGAYGVDIPMWGYSSHLLVVDDLVISLVGGKGTAVVAFDKNTGDERWRALSAADPGYCPPVLVDIQGMPQVLIWDPELLSGLNPEDGRVLWSLPMKARSGMSVTAPQKWDNSLFVSGIGTVPTLLRWPIGDGTPEVFWQARDGRALSTGNSTPVIDKGIIYGVDTRGFLTAVDPLTGRRFWSTILPTGMRPAKYATAFLVKNGDHFYLFNEHGELIAAELSEDGYREISRIVVIEPTTRTYGRNVVWTHPAFANGHVLVRNDREIKRFSLLRK